MVSEEAKQDNEQPNFDELAAMVQTEEVEATIGAEVGQEPKQMITKDTKLNQILDMKLPVIVKIAEKKMTISEILKISHGSLIQFDKGAYQHFDLMVNNSTVGLGQPVKIGEQFGVRITHIGDITDTIRSMGDTGEL